MKTMNIFKKTSILMVGIAASLMGCSSSSSDTPTNPIDPVVYPLASDMVIYEANPKMFATSGAINAIADRLDDLKDMGVNVLWVMPIYEQGSLKSVGSPYCVKNFTTVNPEFGTLEDVKALVTKAHGMGMRVILDWVANHTSWDNAWITDHKDWYSQDASGNIISPPGQNWSDVAQLNFNNKNMRAAMIDAMKYWVSNADVDGFRCDYADGVEDSFWEEAITSLRAVKSDMTMLAEGSRTTLYTDGFDLVYGWNFNSRLQEVFGGSSTLANLYTCNKEELSVAGIGQNRMRYTINHDLGSEKSPIQMYGGERGAIAAFALATMLDGVPMVYSSQEIGYTKAVSFFTYNVMDWNSNASYKAEYKAILNVYKETADVRGGELTTYQTDKVASFYRKTSDKGLLVLVNTSNVAATVKIPMVCAGTRMRNLMTNEVATTSNSVTLGAYEYMILEK